MFPESALKGVMMNHNTPRWSGPMLKIAAVYNILWGSFIVLFPSLPFQWAGMTVPNYPCLCQCIGMIVGVYGVGYWIAGLTILTNDLAWWVPFGITLLSAWKIERQLSRADLRIASELEYQKV